MTTPVLLIDEDDPDQRVTVSMTRAELDGLLAFTSLASLPEDEGLDPETAYKVFVKVTG